MTNQHAASNNQSSKNEDRGRDTGEQPRLSKREAVAALYERLRPGTRRRKTQPNDDANPAHQVHHTAQPSNSSAINETTENETIEPPDNLQADVSNDAPRSELEWNDLISHRIEEAMRNGAFDNLRNKGKPLPQDYNPHVPEDRRMANDLLKNNGLAPQWIGDRTFTLQQIDQFRAKVHERAAGYQRAWRAAPPEQKEQHQEAWTTQLAEWQEEVQRLNRRIESVNFQQPSNSLEIFKVLLPEELKRIGMGYNLSE